MQYRFLVLAAACCAAVPTLSAQATKPAPKADKPHRPAVQNVAFTNLAPKLSLTPATMDRDYRAARRDNPRLTSDQFLTACVLAHNLGGAHPAVSRVAVLSDFKKGRTPQQALTGLGLSATEAKAAAHQADIEVRQADARPTKKSS
jgi:hypothetical protein